MITVGGNLACKQVWAHLPPVFLTLNSEVVITGKEEKKTPLEDLGGLKQGEFIREIIIPKKSGKGVFKKFALTKTDLSAVTVAVHADEELHIAIGGLTSPRRLRELEDRERIDQKRIESVVGRIKPVHHPLLGAVVHGHRNRGSVRNTGKRCCWGYC